MYKVFKVDDFFSEWGNSVFYVGAESLDDLVDHLPDIMKSKFVQKPVQIAKMIIREKDWRIHEIEHMFTDTPYVSLCSDGYLE